MNRLFMIVSYIAVFLVTIATVATAHSTGGRFYGQPVPDLESISDDINHNPRANIFDAVHSRYEKHRGDFLHDSDDSHHDKDKDTIENVTISNDRDIVGAHGSHEPITTPKGDPTDIIDKPYDPDTEGPAPPEFEHDGNPKGPDHPDYQGPEAAPLPDKEVPGDVDSDVGSDVGGETGEGGFDTDDGDD